jgi:hypothetical protein
VYLSIVALVDEGRVLVEHDGERPGYQTQAEQVDVFDIGRDA